MNSFLRKIKLIDDLSLELKIDKTVFVKKLKENIDESDLNYFSSFFEVFSPSKNNYKGITDYNEFKIRKRHRFFDGRRYYPISKGRFTQKGDKLLIDIEIKGFQKSIILFYIILSAFYTFFIFSIYITSKSNVFNILLLFILFHAVFMFLIPIFRFRRGVKIGKKDVKRELIYIANK